MADLVSNLLRSRRFFHSSILHQSQVGGSTDLELRFNLTDEMEQKIRVELDAKGRATPTFEYGFYLEVRLSAWLCGRHLA